MSPVSLAMRCRSCDRIAGFAVIRADADVIEISLCEPAESAAKSGRCVRMK
jgi:hypothetical protein